MTHPEDDLVLVVEDDRDTLETLCEVLAQFGYRPLAAPNGKAALDQLRKMGAPRPCVIILDVMMPVMNGWEFRAEQQRDPALASIPVIFVSADLMADRQAAARGGAAFLTKPVEVDDLMRAVRQVC
jgi:CheY-like chemotaxis protein